MGITAKQIDNYARKLITSNGYAWQGKHFMKPLFSNQMTKLFIIKYMYIGYRKYNHWLLS